MDFCFLADRVDAIPTVASWYFTEWGYAVEGNTVAATCDRLRGRLNRDRLPLHLLAVDATNVLGVAQLKIREMAIYPDREYWLGGVYISSESRGQGVGSALVTRITDMARSLGIQHLSLQTKRLDGGLYARLGWQPVEQVNYHDKEVLVMERTLRD
ncbi:MAG: GNAT family N-acetyltransferase [Cyanobacteria bacterium J06626_18]